MFENAKLKICAASVPQALEWKSADRQEWEKIEAALALDALWACSLGIHILQPEARILFNAVIGGEQNVKSLLVSTDISSRSFFNVMRRLKNIGIIEYIADKSDRRVRRVRVNAKLISFLAASSGS